MSNYAKKAETGAIFRNDKSAPGANPNWPDYKGDALIGGVEMWVSAWIKEGSKGKFMSLAFTPKQAKADKPAPQKAAPKGDFLDDELPPF